MSETCIAEACFHYRNSYSEKAACLPWCNDLNTCLACAGYFFACYSARRAIPLAIDLTVAAIVNIHLTLLRRFTARGCRPASIFFSLRNLRRKIVLYLSCRVTLDGMKKRIHFTVPITLVFI